MKLFFLIIVVLIPASVAAQVQPTIIPIKNHSFEDAVPVQYQRDCGAYTYSRYVTIPGWTATGIVAVVAPVSPRPCDFSDPPDGKQMMAIQNGSISQDLGDVYTLLPHDVNGDGVYTLHFFVAANFYWYSGTWAASLSLAPNGGGGAQPQQTYMLCSQSGIALGDFTEIKVVCPSQRRYGELTLTLAANGYDSLFDNVSLIFTPTN